MPDDHPGSTDSVSGKVLAIVREDLLHARVSALRMLAILAALTLFVGTIWLLFDDLPVVLGLAVVVVMLLSVWIAIILSIQLFKLIFRRRSTLSIYEDRFVWTKHRWLFHRPSQESTSWQAVQTYQHIVDRNSSGIKDELKSAKAHEDAAGGLLIYALFGNLPDRHALWLKLRDGRTIRLSELSGDVHLLDQVVTEINPGTVLRLGPGHYQFNLPAAQRN